MIQNNQGSYSGIKGHPEWKDGRLANRFETAERKVGQEVRVSYQLQPDHFLKYYWQHLLGNRLIELSIIAVDRNTFDCNIKNRNENQVFTFEK